MKKLTNRELANIKGGETSGNFITSKNRRPPAAPIYSSNTIGNIST